jgi:hypothetical protein
MFSGVWSRLRACFGWHGQFERKRLVCLCFSLNFLLKDCYKVKLAHRRPLIVIGGSSETSQESMGSFQEFPQVNVSIIILLPSIILIKSLFDHKVTIAKHFSKYAARPSSLSQISFYIEKVNKIPRCIR